MNKNNIGYIAENMKLIREFRGLTQNQVAKGINISRSSYIAYESGKGTPSLETLILMAKFYNVHVVTFFEEYQCLTDQDGNAVNVKLMSKTLSDFFHKMTLAERVQLLEAARKICSDQ